MCFWNNKKKEDSILPWPSLLDGPWQWRNPLGTSVTILWADRNKYVWHGLQALRVVNISTCYRLGLWVCALLALVCKKFSVVQTFGNIFFCVINIFSSFHVHILFIATFSFVNRFLLYFVFFICFSKKNFKTKILGAPFLYYAPRPAEGRAPPKAVNGRGWAGGIVFFSQFTICTYKVQKKGAT